ncbi:hypothetical protein A0H81_07918 [Grifola frondosa]|uniref:Uncharacterized protein n=1 Tax=Grifola frondosa TaxID=5627 RepID=A0A1C7M729_GRIFR|nr:hypothetical protein A0H81_07918 [Grifola frondosa]
MDATVDILDANEMGPNLKWVDDLFNFRFPKTIGNSPNSFTYSHTIQDIFRITKPLGVPWHQTKCTEHAFTGIYLGFLWDVWNRTVSLPETKRQKYLTKLTLFLDHIARERTSQKDAMSINGTLSHITFVYPQGRSYLTNLCAFIAAFPNKHATRYPPRSVISDLKWWQNTLNLPGVTRSLTPRGELKDLGIWVDASTNWGIGVIVSERWAAWRWKLPLAEWKACGRDIGWAEMVAVELAIRYVEELGHTNADILIRGDNEGVVGAFTRGRSRNFQVNDSIRRAGVIGMSLNLSFKLTYVNTKVNKADPVSRGEPDPSMTRLPPLTTLPPELIPFIVHA